ncbi:MAG: hypothetical protein ACQR30_07340 [Arachidicoccus sp.]
MKKWKFYLGCFLIFFIITDPSFNDFKSFVGNRTVYSASDHSFNSLPGSPIEGQYYRSSNFFLFSFYSSGHYEYLGICGNFIKI